MSRTEPTDRGGILRGAESPSAMIGWLRAYARERLSSRQMDERRCIPPYVVLDFGNAGLLGMEVPREFGGQGMTVVQCMQVFEQLAAIDLTLALFVALHHGLGTAPILWHATRATRAELLPRLASGRSLGAFAMTEAKAGSNPRAITSTARPDGAGRWLLRGRKQWIGNGSWAGITNVFVQELDPSGTPVGMAAFVVRAGTRGLRQGPEALTMGMRAMVQNSVILDDVPVSAEDRLGDPLRGFEVAADAMVYGRLGIGVLCLGGMKKCAQLMLRYAGRRQVSTGVLLENPVTLARLGALTAATTVLETFVYRLAALRDMGSDLPEELYMVSKIAGPEWLFDATDTTMQLLGGRGYIETNGIPQMFRDARLLRIIEGPTETLTMALGSGVLRRDADACERLCTPFGGAAVAARLRSVVEEVRARAANDARWGDRATAERWACALAGEIAALTVLEAAVLERLQNSSAPELRRAHEWLEARYQEVVARALAGSAAEAAVVDSGVLSNAVEGYSASIGDVEQQFADAALDVDDYLRATMSPSTSNASGVGEAEEPPRHARPSERTLVGEGTDARPPAPMLEEIETWLIRYLAERIEADPESIDPSVPFFEFGLDSTDAVELATALADWLARDIDPTFLWNFPTIEALARELAIAPSISHASSPGPRAESKQPFRL